MLRSIRNASPMPPFLCLAASVFNKHIMWWTVGMHLSLCRTNSHHAKLGEIAIARGKEDCPMLT
ncbi:hypothetical protein SAMN06265370_10767 [Puniceibacterium sediminis]|uniref:Uncharacterized protein n=1 Tax=Puniceibacterium sediminis TaxID=1608407 RepID=A0A238WSH7_9RHOB|nr:hypothetical protein SAMN06265370_10767 [Puniceibacterium sediminis]